MEAGELYDGRTVALLRLQGGKDKVKEKGKKGKAVEEEQEEGAVFNIPSAALLEAVLRGVCTMVVVDSRATNRLVNCDMTCLMTLMDHPVPLVQVGAADSPRSKGSAHAARIRDRIPPFTHHTLC